MTSTSTRRWATPGGIAAIAAALLGVSWRRTDPRLASIFASNVSWARGRDRTSRSMRRTSQATGDAGAARRRASSPLLRLLLRELVPLDELSSELSSDELSSDELRETRFRFG